MNKTLFAAGAAVLLSASLALPMAAQAQNIAIVNGKAVPKSRADALIKQVTAQAAAQNQQLPDDLEKRVRDKLVMDEIFTQEAEKKGLAATPEYKAQMEAARQAVLTQALLADYVKTHPVSDADVKAEYDKFKAKSAGTEYRARHILVKSEDEAKALIVKLNAGASFEELAKKNSTDAGSGAKGGDLDFAAPGSYVPEFSAAMVKLKKGEITQTPVKSEFGYHIIKLEDTREAQFPAFDDVKGQIKQRLEQQRLAEYRDEIRAKAKTDYTFTN